MLYSDSVTAIGKSRFNSSPDTYIPCVKFQFSTFDVSGSLYLLVPHYGNKVLRLFLEMLDGVRMAPENQKFLEGLSAILQSPSDFLSSEYQDIIDDIITVRATGIEYQEVFFDDDLWELFVNASQAMGVPVISSEIGLSGNVFVQDEPDYNYLHDLLEQRPELFASFESLTNVDDYCYVGHQVIYPEDLYDDENMRFEVFNSSLSGIYNDYIALSQVLSAPQISQKQRDMFTRVHCTCGYEFVFHIGQKGYSNLHCLNPHCQNKMVWSLALFIKNLGVIGLGAQSMLSSVQSIWYNRLLRTGISAVYYSDLLCTNYAMYFTPAMGDKYGEFLERLSEYSGSLKSLVKACGLPYIGEYASQVINEDVLTCAETFQDFLEYCRGTKVKKLSVAHSIYMYLDDIQDLYEYSKAKDLRNAVIFKICMSGRVKFRDQNGMLIPKMSKDVYVDMLNHHLSQVATERPIVVERLKSLTSEAIVLVNDTGENHGKVRSALDNGLAIVTSNQLFDYFFNGGELFSE